MKANVSIGPGAVLAVAGIAVVWYFWSDLKKIVKKEETNLYDEQKKDTIVAGVVNLDEPFAATKRAYYTVKGWITGKDEFELARAEARERYYTGRQVANVYGTSSGE